MNYYKNLSLINIKNEKWKTSDDMKGRYSVSNFGRVKSLSRKTRIGQFIYERIIKQSFDQDGYLRVGLCLERGKVGFRMNRLVALVFIPNPDNKPEVNHKNTIKTDNWVKNLEWATRQENQAHAIEMGLWDYRGQENETALLTNIQAIQIFKSKKTRKELSKMYGVSVEIIYSIKSGKTWGWLTGKEYKRINMTAKEAKKIFGSKLSYSELARTYRVSEKTISDIKIGYSWNSVTGLPCKKKIKTQ